MFGSERATGHPTVYAAAAAKWSNSLHYPTMEKRRRRGEEEEEKEKKEEIDV